MEGHRLFRKDRQGRQGGVSPSMSMTSRTAGSCVWGWMRSQPRAYGSGLKARQGLVALQWGSATGHMTRKTEWMSPSVGRALVLMGDFNHPDICWRDNTARHKQSRRFLDCIDDKFLLHVIKEPMGRGAMLDLSLSNNVKLVGNVKLKGSLGCSGHKIGGVQDP